MKQSYIDIKYDKERYWDKLMAYTDPSKPLPAIDPQEDRLAVIHDLNIYADIIHNLREDDLYGTPGAIIAEDIMIFLSMRSVYKASTSPHAWISSENEPILSKILHIISPMSVAESSTLAQWKKITQLISKLDTN